MVVEKLLATLLLLAEVIALLMASTGTRTVDEDGQSPLFGAMLFTAMQANFLIIGNHFC